MDEYTIVGPEDCRCPDGSNAKPTRWILRRTSWEYEDAGLAGSRQGKYRRIDPDGGWVDIEEKYNVYIPAFEITEEERPYGCP